MRAMEILNPGQNGRLGVCETAIPEPKPHEVLVKVACAGVNRADVFQKQGSYPPPENASPLPGLEVAGEIAATGPAVTQWRVGEKVCALLSGGGYAEYAVAHAGHILPVPKGWTLEEAAALPEALFTVWMALHDDAGLQAGEHILIHGGASGVGMIAIQYAAQLGATVYATAGTPEKCAACESWGAGQAIHYRQEDFVKAIKSYTHGKGVNVVLDMVGGDYITRNFKVLAPEGRLISIAFLGGSRLEHLSAGALLLKRLTWKGATLRARSDDKKSSYAQAIHAALWPKLEKGVIKPVIDSVYPLENAEKAHQRMEQNLNIGKIVLQV